MRPQHLFPIGRLRDAAVEVLAVTNGRTLGKTLYRVRYACCQREDEITHLALSARAYKGGRRLACGAPVAPCNHCARAIAGETRRRRRQAALLGMESHFPIDDPRLGRVTDAPLWPRPPSARGGLWADRA